MVNGVATGGGHDGPAGTIQSLNHNKGQEQGFPQTGVARDTPNGVLTNGNGLSLEGRHAIPSSVLHSIRELPPEIMHITAGYQPLSRLIVRLAQDTFRNLIEVIGTMAEMPMPQQTPQANSYYINNHMSTNGVNGRASNSIAKRQLLLEFGQDRRAQFIKLLVLSQWSQKATDVSKVIDLKVWLDNQRYQYNDAGTWLGEMKRNLAPARVPNPDLRTSLEILSTGNASWLPDLGYLPPEPLGPHQILKTLRNINTLLSIRLNLHENLPPHFSTFSIASGRATFSVPKEFEVDLSIADEDPSSQLYFIDFRFLFSPVASTLPPGRLRDEVEGKTNDLLKNAGLSGCYEFLHELVLTHKINILRKQAVEMAKGKWVESVQLETVRRTLVLQYWLNRPGGKSWIELGIRSGRRKDGKQILKNGGAPYIGIRWFRNGKEVENPSISIDLGLLSMEAILKSVTSFHINYVLSSIANGLAEVSPLYANELLSFLLTPSAAESLESSLEVQVTRLRTVSISIEPVTGRIILQPASPLFSRLEWELNGMRDLTREGPSAIARTRCTIAQDEIETTARCVGWESVKNLGRKDEESRAFPRDTRLVCYFRRKGWNPNWVMAVSIGTGGEAWWIMQTKEVSTGRVFQSFQLIPMHSSVSVAPTITYAFLLRLEHTSAGMISLFVNSRALAKDHITHEMRPTKPRPVPSSIGRCTAHIPTLYVRLSSLMIASQPRPTTPWAKETIRITYRGAIARAGQAISLVEAKLANPISVTNNTDDDVAFHPISGAFAFKLRAPVGDKIVPKLLSRLKRLERLSRLVEVVQRLKLSCSTISLGRIVFTYHSDPQLQADIGFIEGLPMTLRLAQGNPHLRIADFLTGSLNSMGGLEHMTLLLGLTRPLLLTLGALESLRDNNRFFVLPRSADWLRIKYRQPDCSFDVRLRIRRDDTKWFVHQLRLPSPGATPHFDHDGFANALKALFSQSGYQWMGLGTGIVAGVEGISEVIRKIHDLVEQFRSSSITRDTAVVEPKQPVEERQVVVLD
ncbi:MAG: mediator complex subunit [Candelina mexicana]|nr:MAG: mediator complex subunit [Candelina mexicana]